MNKVLDYVDEMISNLKKDLKIKRMIKLKESINNNLEIRSLISKMNNSIDIKETKTILYNNKEVKEYLLIQNELDYNIMYFNNKLSKLLDEKDCGNH
jgi:hypothetical protein